MEIHVYPSGNAVKTQIAGRYSRKIASFHNKNTMYKIATSLMSVKDKPFSTTVQTKSRCSFPKIEADFWWILTLPQQLTILYNTNTTVYFFCCKYVYEMTCTIISFESSNI